MRVDIAGLDKAIELLGNINNDFVKSVEDFYDCLNQYVGQTEGEAWYGPKAGKFVDYVNKFKESTFAPSSKGILDAQSSLEEHRNAWVNFEG